MWYEIPAGDSSFCLGYLSKSDQSSNFVVHAPPRVFFGVSITLSENRKSHDFLAMLVVATLFSVPSIIFLMLLVSNRETRELLDTLLWRTLLLLNSVPSVQLTVLALYSMSIWAIVLGGIQWMVPGWGPRKLLQKPSQVPASRNEVLICLIAACLGMLAIACSEFDPAAFWDNAGSSALKFFSKPFLTLESSQANLLGFLFSWLAFFVGIAFYDRYSLDRDSSWKFLAATVIGGSTILLNLMLNLILRGI